MLAPDAQGRGVGWLLVEDAPAWATGQGLAVTRCNGHCGTAICHSRPVGFAA